MVEFHGDPLTISKGHSGSIENPPSSLPLTRKCYIEIFITSGEVDRLGIWKTRTAPNMKFNHQSQYEPASKKRWKSKQQEQTAKANCMFGTCAGWNLV